MKTRLKIGYFADGPWAHGALELLTNDPNLEIAFVCARYGRPDEYLRKKACDLKLDFLVEQDVNADCFLSHLC